MVIVSNASWFLVATEICLSTVTGIFVTDVRYALQSCSNSVKDWGTGILSAGVENWMRI